ncbi:hypothetical protein AHAS_Ahas16G0103400 [Arachis hypogaea]
MHVHCSCLILLTSIEDRTRFLAHSTAPTQVTRYNLPWVTMRINLRATKKLETLPKKYLLQYLAKNN